MPTVAAYRQQQKKADQDALIVNHLEYVQQIFGQLIGTLPQGVDREGLLSAGTVGLVEAARSFDPEQNASFKTFSYQRIRGAMAVPGQIRPFRYAGVHCGFCWGQRLSS